MKLGVITDGISRDFDHALRVMTGAWSTALRMVAVSVPVSAPPPLLPLSLMVIVSVA